MAPDETTRDELLRELEALRRENEALRQEQERLRASEAQLRAAAQTRAPTAAGDGEERFRRLADAVPVGVYLTDDGGRCTFANARWLEMAGLTLGEAQGDGWLRGIHPDDRTRILRSWRQMVESGGRWGLEYRFQAPTGQTTQVYGLASPLLDARGRVTGYVGSNTDVTELRRARQALRESEKKYRELVELAQDGVWAIDGEARTTFVNPRMAEILGYSVEEMAGRSLFSFMDEERAREALQKFEARRRGVKEHHDFTFLRSDGTPVHTRVATSPLVDESGTFSGAQAIVADVTERRQSEEALRRSEAQYRAVVETQLDGFLAVDGEGRLVDVNEAYLRRSGYARGELLSMRVSDLEARESAAQTAAHLQEVARRGAHLFESAHRAKDGAVFPVEVSASYWQIEGGRVFTLVRDISRRKRAEYLLRARVELLELAARGPSDAVLQFALDQAELLTASRIGFFHFVDDDQNHLSLQTWSTNTLSTACTAEAKGSHYPIDQAGVWVDCVRTLRPTIHNDYASLPHRRGLPAGHAPVVRELVVPILHGGRLTAIVGVGNKSTDYTEDDVTPVRELGSMAMEAVAREQTLEALRQSETRLATVFRTHLVGVGVSHLSSGRFVDVNDAFCAFIGIPRGEVLGRTAQALGFWAHPERRDAFVDELRDRGRVTELEVEVRRSSGELRTLTLSAEVVQLGGTAHAIVLASDVTARRRAEKELEGLCEQTRRDFLAKSRLLMEVNHRVKNNLLALQGMLLVEQRLSPAEGRPWVEASFGRVLGRVRALVAAHDLLAKGEWGPVRVADLVEQAIRGAPGGVLRLEAPPSGLLVSPRQAGSLAIVLHELAANTARHALGGRGEALVRVTVSQEGEFLRLEYRDDGPGYPPGALAGEGEGVGLRLLGEIAAGSLGGSLRLANQGGAVATLLVRVEEPERT